MSTDTISITTENGVRESYDVPTTSPAGRVAGVRLRPGHDHALGDSHVTAPPGPDQRQSGYIYPPLLERAKAAARLKAPNFMELRRMRASVELAYPSPPAELVAAQSSALAAITKADQAADVIDDLPDAQARANEDHAQAVRTAYAAGKPLPLATYDSIAAEQIARLNFDQAMRAAEAELRNFNEVKLAVTDEWRTALAGQVASSWDDLAEAVRVVAPAMRRWSATKGGCEQMSRDLGVMKPTDFEKPVGERALEGAALAGLAKLVQLVENAGDITSGAYLADTVEPAAR